MASQVMANGDHGGHIFLDPIHPRIIGFFFLLTIKYRIFMFKKGSLR